MNPNGLYLEKKSGQDRDLETCYLRSHYGYLGLSHHLGQIEEASIAGTYEGKYLEINFT